MTFEVGQTLKSPPLCAESIALLLLSCILSPSLPDDFAQVPISQSSSISLYICGFNRSLSEKIRHYTRHVLYCLSMALLLTPSLVTSLNRAPGTLSSTYEATTSSRCHASQQSLLTVRFGTVLNLGRTLFPIFELSCCHHCWHGHKNLHYLLLEA